MRKAVSSLKPIWEGLPRLYNYLLERKIPFLFFSQKRYARTENVSFNVSATPQTRESKEQMRKEIAGFFDKLNKSRLLE